MAPIGWPTIGADIIAVSFAFDLLLCAVVMSCTQTLQATLPEFVDVAVMWLDVIGDLRGHDLALAFAHATKRLFH